MTPEQLAFLRRIGIDSAAIAIAMQTGVTREFIAGEVERYGSMNVYGRKPDGKPERVGECFERLWPVAKKVRK